MPKKETSGKKEDEEGYVSINVKHKTKKRFSTKFKEYQETEDTAMTRLMDKAKVEEVTN